MRANQAEFPVATMCRTLDLSTSGYYAWVQREPSARDVANAAPLGVQGESGRYRHSIRLSTPIRRKDGPQRAAFIGRASQPECPIIREDGARDPRPDRRRVIERQTFAARQFASKTIMEPAAIARCHRP